MQVRIVLVDCDGNPISTHIKVKEYFALIEEEVLRHKKQIAFKYYNRKDRLTPFAEREEFEQAFKEGLWFEEIGL